MATNSNVILVLDNQVHCQVVVAEDLLGPIFELVDIFRDTDIPVRAEQIILLITYILLFVDLLSAPLLYWYLNMNLAKKITLVFYQFLSQILVQGIGINSLLVIHIYRYKQKVVALRKYCSRTVPDLTVAKYSYVNLENAPDVRLEL